MRDALSGSPSLLVSGFHSGGGQVVFFSAGGSRAVDLPLTADSAADLSKELPLGAWAGDQLPRRVTSRSERKLWAALTEDGPIEEVASSLVKMLGVIDLENEPWRALGECTGAVDNTAENNWVGTRLVGISGTQFTIGQGEDFWGLWDWDAPAAPVQRFPKTWEGLQEAKAVWRQRSVWPLLATMHPTGTRTWAVLPELNLAVLVLFTDERQVFVIICDEDARTYAIAGPGPARLSQSQMGLIGLRPNIDSNQMVIETLAEVHRYAEINTSRAVPLTWNTVPPEVAGDLLTTYEWVRRQALAQP